MSTSEIPIDWSDSRTLQAEHASLLDHVEHIRLAAMELPSLSPEERQELVERILGFVQGELVRHAESEERTLYPWVARLLGDPRATAPMVYDHETIRQLASRLSETNVDEVALLQELLYGLHALITVHFRKEEELYVPLLHSENTEAHVITKRNGGGDD